MLLSLQCAVSLLEDQHDILKQHSLSNLSLNRRFLQTRSEICTVITTLLSYQCVSQRWQSIRGDDQINGNHHNDSKETSSGKNPEFFGCIKKENSKNENSNSHIFKEEIQSSDDSTLGVETNIRGDVNNNPSQWNLSIKSEVKNEESNFSFASQPHLRSTCNFKNLLSPNHNYFSSSTEFQFECKPRENKPKPRKQRLKNIDTFKKINHKQLPKYKIKINSLNSVKKDKAPVLGSTVAKSPMNNGNKNSVQINLTSLFLTISEVDETHDNKLIPPILSWEEYNGFSSDLCKVLQRLSTFKLDINANELGKAEGKSQTKKRVQKKPKVKHLLHTKCKSNSRYLFQKYKKLSEKRFKNMETFYTQTNDRPSVANDKSEMKYRRIVNLTEVFKPLYMPQSNKSGTNHGTEGWLEYLAMNPYIAEILDKLSYSPPSVHFKNDHKVLKTQATYAFPLLAKLDFQKYKNT